MPFRSAFAFGARETFLRRSLCDKSTQKSGRSRVILKAVEPANATDFNITGYVTTSSLNTAARHADRSGPVCGFPTTKRGAPLQNRHRRCAVLPQTQIQIAAYRTG